MSSPANLRRELLRFVADFADWDAGVSHEHIEIARKLVAAAHPAGNPMVVDPFAGTGSVPFEALRLGASTFASDLNPVAVLLNKVALRHLPRYRTSLRDGVEKWGRWILTEARKRLAPYYPCDQQGNVPQAYYWARTVRCEGPTCGAEVPLLGMLWLSRDRRRNYALRYRGDRDAKCVEVDVFNPKTASDVQPSLSKRFSVTCPVCGYTTAYKRVREQIRLQKGGARSSRLLATGVLSPSGERVYRVPAEVDERAVERARLALQEWTGSSELELSPSLVPDEPYPDWYSGVFNPGLWGLSAWGDFFTERQALAMATFCELVRSASVELREASGDEEYATAVTTCLALAVAKMSIYNASTCYIHPDFGLKTVFLGAGMAMVGDFAEVNPLMDKYVGGFDYACTQVVAFLSREASSIQGLGDVEQATAREIPLPDDAVDYVITDPPYYAAVPYSHLSDYCYVWLKRMLRELERELMEPLLTPKDEELIAYYVQPSEGRKKDVAFFEARMEEALADARRVLSPGGVGVIIFAHKGTSGWEALLNALVNAGWTVTASWPIDTENQQRWRAAGAAALGSSVHLVCRPRQGSEDGNDVGDWRAVLRELPVRIHEWMPRLADEGIVGADAVFACLGPALEVFSRHERVEKANGDVVELREYLEYVWVAVAREALSLILDAADTSGLEEDARLTAIWLWTLSSGANEEGMGHGRGRSESGGKSPANSFSLEFDAARKIAQGVGAHLERLDSVVEVKGNQARLLSVAERTRHLFGKEEVGRTSGRGRGKKKAKQLTLFEELEAVEKDSGWGDVGVPPPGETTLERVHQAMVLFAGGRSGALKRFLVEEAIGTDARFWKLAQSLSALYPTGTDEKRWVEGVLARKQRLGFG